jgi:hypothetical protein
MKTAKLFTFFFGLLGILNAQITVQFSDLPNVGNTLWQVNDTSGSPSISGPINSGANATWNYTSGWVNVDTTAITFANVITVDPSIRALFPTANLVYDQVEDSTLLFFARNTDGMYVAGTYLYGSQDVNGILLDSVASVFVNPELLVPVPFTYNDTRSNSSYLVTALSLELPGFGLVDLFQKRRSDKAIACVGHGNLTTPSGTYNCLLMKTQITVYDTLYTANPFVGPLLNNDTITHSVNYMWITNDVNQVIVMEANADSAGLIFNSASYSYKGNVSHQDLSVSSAIRMYPNPANDYITIELPQGQHDGYLLLYSIEGKLTTKLPLGAEAVQTLNVSGIQQGRYLGCIQINGTRHCGNVIISR